MADNPNVGEVNRAGRTSQESQESASEPVSVAGIPVLVSERFLPDALAITNGRTAVGYLRGRVYGPFELSANDRVPDFGPTVGRFLDGVAE